jgi:hypothetical protein
MKNYILIAVFLISSMAYTQTRYHVIVGSSKKVSVSNKIKKKFQKKGYSDTQILTSNNKPADYRVSVRSFGYRRLANEYKNKLKNSGLCKDAWVLSEVENRYSNVSKPEFNFIQFFKNFADDSNVQFEYIENYRKGALQDLLYNKLADIPTYLVVVDISNENQGRRNIYNYYVISKEDVGRTREVIKTNSQAIGMDLWAKIIRARSNKTYHGLENLDEKSIKEFYWEDTSFKGYKYSFDIIQ